MSAEVLDLAGADSHLSRPLHDLERRVVERFPDVEAWLLAEFGKTPPPFYFSVDLRNNGHKIVPIDTNLFPGGFNNLPASSYSLAIETLKKRVRELCPGVRGILLVPERHTRNPFYLDNVAVIRYLLESAGVAVRVGLPGIDAPLRLVSGKGAEIVVEPVVRKGARLAVGDFVPCAALLNNDLSSEAPEWLDGVDTPVIPDPSAGWQVRRKSAHFHQYERIAGRFAALIDFDPWFITPAFSLCDKVDVGRGEGLDCLAAAIDETLADLAANYAAHGVQEDPFVVLKADAGTYGMGVVTVKASAEVHSLNRRRRKELSFSKGGVPIRDILIQEGIHTIDHFGATSAEPVVYGIDGTVVGGFYRGNERRARDENLNTPGMSFVPLPFDTASRPPCQLTREQPSEGSARLYVYGVVARLAALAAAREPVPAAAGGGRAPL